MLRDDMTSRLQGFALRNSAGLKLAAKGTGVNYLVNGSHSAGSREIAIKTGSGTVLAGDVVTFAGDTNKYIVNKTLAGGKIKIGKPGLLMDHSNSDAMTIENVFSPNIAWVW